MQGQLWGYLPLCPQCIVPVCPRFAAGRGGTCPGTCVAHRLGGPVACKLGATRPRGALKLDSPGLRHALS